MNIVRRLSSGRFIVVLLATSFGQTFFAGGVDAGATGADACGDASIVPITVGPVGSPTVTVLSGDLTTATAPDCDFSQDVGVALWWEAFELTECADVTIELCGTTPQNTPARNYLYPNCPGSGTSCGAPIFAAQQSRLQCADHNVWLSFPQLQPGIYYFPILADPNVLVNSPGTYQITLTAQQCTGSCCDLTAGTCADLVLFADCAEPDQVCLHGAIRASASRYAWIMRIRCSRRLTTRLTLTFRSWCPVGACSGNHLSSSATRASRSIAMAITYQRSPRTSRHGWEMRR